MYSNIFLQVNSTLNDTSLMCIEHQLILHLTILMDGTTTYSNVLGSPEVAEKW